MTPAQAATIAACAEAMYAPDIMTPELDKRLADDWTLIEHITAVNALLGTQVLGLGDRVWYGFLAQSKADPAKFIVAIRGTENFVEWLIDAQAFVIGHVHAGFMSIWRTMQCGMPALSVADGISTRVPIGSTVTIVGHSLGAPLAAYTLLGLRQMNVNARGMFFAMPKPGDAAYAEAFDRIVGADRYMAWNWLLDVVPQLPVWLPLHQFKRLNNQIVIRPGDSAFELPRALGGKQYLEEQHHCTNYASLLANLKPVQEQAA